MMWIRDLILWGTLALLALVACCTTGCVSARDAAILSANTSAEFGADTEAAFAALYEQEQRECLPTSHPAECVDDVRVAWAPRWRAYRVFRAAWLALAGAIRAGSDADVVSASAALSKAEFELARSMR